MQIKITSMEVGRQQFSKTFTLRFWNKVNKNGQIQSHVPELGKCWQWTGGLGDEGYGTIRPFYKQTFKAHRASWIIHNGPIPNGFQVLHRCDNRGCVNPNHLFIGSNEDNVRDKLSKGRAGCLGGELHPGALTDWKNVHSIRALYNSGGITQRELSAMFGIARRTISHIVCEDHWITSPIPK